MTEEAQVAESEPKMTEAEAKEFREIAKIVGYGVWKYEFNRSNPNASPEEMKAAWEAARDAQIKAGKKAVLALKKSGFVVTKH